MFQVRSTISKAKTRWRNQRGAVIVETALAIPILLMVIMGSIEFGFGWEAKSASASGVRTGVLRAASIGDQPETDMRILQSIIGEIGTENVDRIEYVMVFNATGHTDKEAAIAGCEAGAGTTQCVLYSTSILQAISASADPGAYQAANFDLGGNVTRDGAGDIDGYACTFGKLDTNWCAGSRTVLNDVEIGIAVSYNHKWVTGILPFDAPQFNDYSISSTFLSTGSQISSSTGVPSIGGTTKFVAGFSSSPVNTADVTWTGNTVVETSPTGGEEILGRFASESVSVTIDNLAPHSQVCVSFNLIVVGSWDTNTGKWGPDTVDFQIDGAGDGPTTYSRGGSDPLGYGPSTGWSNSRVIPISKCVPHTADSVTLDFVGSLIEHYNPVLPPNTSNESWGISGLEVTTT